ncbi:MAG: hypothetical protein ABIZ80_02830, partial [Bryobacteraceae bacterium]
MLPAPWLIYALGGGWGHLMRSLAFGRLAGRARPVTILCNSPYAAVIERHAGPAPEGCTLLPVLSAAEAAAQVSREWGCLVVDTFPRGLGGELAYMLPQYRAPKVLVHRDVNPAYVRAKSLD